MRARRLIRILGCAAAAVGFAGCAGGAHVLEVPDGSAMCAEVLPSEPESHWFGVPVSNPGQRPITLKAVQLGEHDHILLNEALAVPPLRLHDGTMLGVGVMHDPATENADLWAGSQPVGGYTIAPGANVHLALALSLDAAETGQARTQIITYHVDGELFQREATSLLELAVTNDCQTLA